MSTSSFEQRICAMFDSFCKTVSRNYVRNLERAERNRQKHIMDAPVSFFLELLGHEDHHPSDTFAFCINEHAYEIADKRVYHALLGLPKKQQVVIITASIASQAEFTAAAAGAYTAARSGTPTTNIAAPSGNATLGSSKEPAAKRRT